MLAVLDSEEMAKQKSLEKNKGACLPGRWWMWTLGSSQYWRSGAVGRGISFSVFLSYSCDIVDNRSKNV
jgi:hypothetical protein